MTWPFKKNRASKQAIVLDGNNQGIVVNGSITGNIIQGSGAIGEHQLTQLHIPWDSKPDPALIPSMLHWKSRISPQLIGRDADMEKMLQWAQSDFPLKMRLIYAQGGMGKTRFAFELAEQLIQQGRKAGQMLQPDARVAYAPDLALSLNNLSSYLAESGQREQGLAAIQSAVAIQEQLAEQNFAAYAPYLVLSLNNLSAHLAEQGDTSNAMSNCERAVELITPFAKPGTLYADWQQAMQNQLARLKGK